MRKYTLFISGIAALGGLLFGFDTAVIAGATRSLTDYFSLGNTQIGLIVAAASLGCIPGAFFAGKLADRYGRKKMLLLTSVFYLIAALGSGIAGSYFELVIYRFVGGIAIGLASTLTPIYISEIAPARFRGRLGMMQQLAIVLGILLSFISNYYISNLEVSMITVTNVWRFMLVAALVPSLIFFVLLLFIPESPRWLASGGKKEKAALILSKIYQEGDLTKERSAIIENLSVNRNINQTKFREIFSQKYRKVVWIGIAFAALAQLTGINIIFYYAPMIFEKMTLGSSPLFQTILTGVVNLLFTLLAFFLIDRVGRKMLLLIGSLIMGICMLITGMFFLLEATGTYLILIPIFIFIGAFASSWGVVLWVYVAEIFPTKIRGNATSFAVFGNWVSNGIVSFTFPLLLNGLGAATCFFLYGIINLGMIVFVQKYIFETKGVPLEAIEKYYKI